METCGTAGGKAFGHKGEKLQGVLHVGTEEECDLYQQASFRRAAGSEFRPGGLLLTEELAVACALRPGQRVLDLGCGAGSTASYLRDCWKVKAFGLDASPGMLEEAQARDPQVQWAQGRAEAAPFPDGHFAAVFAECFLSTVDDAGAVLSEVKRVLRPGGRLALSDMFLRAPEARPLALAPRATCLGGAVGIDTTLEALQRAGFAVDFWSDRSDALKTLMVSLIFAYGSEAGFWKASAGEEPTREALQELRSAHPGYYVLVATATPQARVARPSSD